MRKILSNLFGRLNLHIMPALIWLVAVICVAGLFQHRWQRFEIVGVAQGQVREVAAAVTGRLKTVSVELFETVQRGQVLATLDDELLNVQIATISAEIERLQAELNATLDLLATEEADRQTNWVGTYRRFCFDAEQARLSTLQLKTQLETDRMMLVNLELDVKVSSQLLAKDAIAPYELDKAKAAYDALVTQIRENKNLMTQYEQDLQTASQRRDEFAQSRPANRSIDEALNPIRKAIKVQEGLINELSAQRVELVLKAPIDGVVIQIRGRANEVALHRPGEGILHKPGEIVLAGETILTITETRPTEIIAYADESQTGQIKANMKVELVKNNPPAQIAKSQIIHVGPAIEPVPMRLLRNINVPQWGRPFLVKIPPGLELTPGELVGIRGL
jgi:multidrug efflux pump subunit AcrA (membrane-fusion protein)